MRNLIQRNWQKITLFLFVFLLPVVSFAGDTIVTPTDPCAGKICNPLGQNGPNSLPLLIQHILTGFLQIGIPVVALAIIYSGFLFVFARGKEEKLTEAKSALLYAVIGAAVLLGAWTIAQIISSTVLGLH